MSTKAVSLQTRRKHTVQRLMDEEVELDADRRLGHIHSLIGGGQVEVVLSPEQPHLPHLPPVGLPQHRAPEAAAEAAVTNEDQEQQQNGQEQQAQDGPPPADGPQIVKAQLPPSFRRMVWVRKGQCVVIAPDPGLQGKVR